MLFEVAEVGLWKLCCLTLGFCCHWLLVVQLVMFNVVLLVLKQGFCTIFSQLTVNYSLFGVTAKKWLAKDKKVSNNSRRISGATVISHWSFSALVLYCMLHNNVLQPLGFLLRGKTKGGEFPVSYYLCTLLQRTKKDVDKFAVKTMSWTGGIQGSKYRLESAREGVYSYVGSS